MGKKMLAGGAIISAILLLVCIYVIRINFSAGLILLFLPIFLLVLSVNIWVKIMLSNKK